jgi:hypothetical protein
MSWEFAEFGGLPVGETTRTTPSEAAATGGFFSGDLGSVYDLGWAHGPAVATGGVGGTVTAQELADLEAAFRAEHGHGWLDAWIPYTTFSPVSVNVDAVARQYHQDMLRAQLLADYEEQHALIESQWGLNLVSGICGGASFGISDWVQERVHWTGGLTFGSGVVQSAGHGEREAGALLGAGLQTVATLGASGTSAIGTFVRGPANRALAWVESTWVGTRLTGLTVRYGQGFASLSRIEQLAIRYHESIHLWQFRNFTTLMRWAYGPGSASFARMPLRYMAELQAYFLEGWRMRRYAYAATAPVRSILSLPARDWIPIGLGAFTSGIVGPELVFGGD